MDTNNNTNSPQTPTSPTPPVTEPIGATPPSADTSAGNPLATSPSLQMPKPDISQPGATAGIPQPSPSSSEKSVGPLPSSTPPPPVHHKGNPMLWVIILLVFAFLCGLFLAAWYFQTQLQKVTPEKQTAQPTVAVPQTIVIGTDATFQPMEYIASEGALVGYDIDLGTRIAQDLGSKAEFKNIPWDDLFKALEDKEVDMIMSSVTITDERKQLYDFSETYLNAGQVILTKKENTTITSAQTLQGKKIAVQEGTTNEQEALKHTTASLVIRFPDFVQAIKALVEGRVDAILSDLPGAKGIVLANPTLKIASDPLTNEYYGIVFRKGDPTVQKINDIISSLRTQGILTDLKQKWLD